MAHFTRGRCGGFIALNNAQTPVGPERLIANYDVARSFADPADPAGVAGSCDWRVDLV
jgi:hypothetical protein